MHTQIFNAIKYCSAFPALVLTAIEHEYHVAGRPFPYARPWLAAALVNTLYSFYWDVEMDWDMPWLAQPGAQGRRRAEGWSGVGGGGRATSAPWGVCLRVGMRGVFCVLCLTPCRPLVQPFAFL